MLMITGQSHNGSALIFIPAIRQLFAPIAISEIKSRPKAAVLKILPCPPLQKEGARLPPLEKGN